MTTDAQRRAMSNYNAAHKDEYIRVGARLPTDDQHADLMQTLIRDHRQLGALRILLETYAQHHHPEG